MVENYPTLIVEDNSLFREGLKLLLEKTEFSPTTCCLDDCSVSNDVDPDILIIFAHDNLDLSVTITGLRERFMKSRIVVLATVSDLDLLTSAVHAGANAILLTSISAEGLIKSLKAVVADNIFVMDSRIWPLGATPPLWQTGEAINDLPAGMRCLSQREIEIIQRVVAGDSNKHIARYLDIAEATVKAHVKTILRKIGATNRTQAAIWAMQQGIEQLDQMGAVDVQQIAQADLVSAPGDQKPANGTRPFAAATRMLN